MIRKVIFGIVCYLLCLGGIESQAQIAPVHFLCVKNDTLKWNAPLENCGDFLHYQIYYSENINGTYNTLTTITNPNTSSFYHTNANSVNVIWYYYIQSVYDCPNGISPPSDTLDNRDPDFPILQAAQVEGNQVVLSWEHSLAPETMAYIIFRKNENNGFDAIDTVPVSQNIYIDENAQANEKSEEYTVMSLDACGNTSIFNTKSHATLFLTVDINACTQSATLHWNKYKNWENGIDKQIIQVYSPSNNYFSSDTLSATDSTYTVSNLDKNVTYQFSVAAIPNGIENVKAVSNLVSVTADVVQPSQNLTLLSASYTEDEKIELIWAWDTIAELNQAMILQVENMNNSHILHSFTPPTPLPYLDTIIIENNTNSTESQYFAIQSQDLCDSTNISNQAATIALSGKLNTSTNEHKIEWSPMYVDNATITSYQLFTITSNGEKLLGTFPNDVHTFQESLMEYDANACYYVVGRGHITLPNGQLYGISSRSLNYCLQRQATIVFPNAFTRYGKNTIFKPRVIFPENITQYELLIFNRWGKLMFQSHNVEQGWQGNNAPKGSYIYTMKATFKDGTREIAKGSVLLMD